MVDFEVQLDAFSDSDVPIYAIWFLASNPDSMTCRPVGDLNPIEMMESFRERFDGKSAGHFAVRRVMDNVLVGRVTFFDLNPKNGAVEIGYLIGPEFRGRGYAFQGVALLLKHLFDDLGLKKAMAQTGEFNSDSTALLNRLGFKQEGRLRRHHLLDDKLYDDLLFSILSEEFDIDKIS